MENEDATPRTRTRYQKRKEEWDQENEQRFGKMTDREVHGFLTDHRWIYTACNSLVQFALQEIKAAHSYLAKRGYPTKAIPTKPSSMRRPRLGKGASEHAMIRYLERVKGMDMGALEAEMLARVEEGESYYGGAVVIDKDGFGYVLREDGLIKSVMPHEWLNEAAGAVAEQEFKLKRREDKDAHYRGLAAQGLDTSQPPAQNIGE